MVEAALQGALIHDLTHCGTEHSSRQLRGRDLLSLESMHDRIVLSVSCRVIKSEHSSVCFVHKHQIAGEGVFLYSKVKCVAGISGVDFNTRVGLVDTPMSHLKHKCKEAAKNHILR